MLFNSREREKKPSAPLVSQFSLWTPRPALDLSLFKGVEIHAFVLGREHPGGGPGWEGVHPMVGWCSWVQREKNFGGVDAFTSIGHTRCLPCKSNLSVCLDCSCLCVVGFLVPRECSLLLFCVRLGTSDGQIGGVDALLDLGFHGHFTCGTDTL
jgi:hypothetical protein